MINERDRHIWRRMGGRGGVVACTAGRGVTCPTRDDEMSGMTAFLIAVGGVSAGCYLLMMRADNIRARRGPAGDSSGSNGGAIGATGDGWSLLSWFGGDTSPSGNSGSSGDFGGGDSGGGDSGGGCE